MLDIYRFSSPHDGPHLLLLGAIHGNEVAGPNALGAFIQQIETGQTQLACGRLTIVPICNPKANQADLRYIQHNLNRLFSDHQIPGQDSYEGQLAQAIKPLIRDADFMLDIHSTHTKDDVPLGFYNKTIAGTYDLAACLPVPYLCCGWEDTYGGEDYTTESYAGLHNTIGLTLECGYHKDGGAQKLATDSLRRALNDTGIIPDQAIKKQTKPSAKICRFRMIYPRKPGDRFVTPYKNLDAVQAGDPIVENTDTKEIWHAPSDGAILIPYPDAKPGEEFFYFGTWEG